MRYAKCYGAREERCLRKDKRSERGANRKELEAERSKANEERSIRKYEICDARVCASVV
jgi:hypothetical protein